MNRIPHSFLRFAYSTRRERKPRYLPKSCGALTRAIPAYPPLAQWGRGLLALTRYCYYQYCIWCIAYKREFGGGVVYCPIIVQ